MWLAPQLRALVRHLNLQKWFELRTPSVLYILTWKCASRHNGVYFFDISTSKSGPNVVCFVDVDLECASRHNGVHFLDISTFKSGPRLKCFVHFDLEMCFAPQRRFAASQLPKVVRTWCVLYILTCKLFISHLASWLCTRRFSEPTF